MLIASLVKQIIATAVVVEIGYFVAQFFNHIGHAFFWEHYGWWVVIVAMAIFAVADLVADDSINDRYFYDQDV